MKEFFVALKFSLLVVGAIVGAGLASGQEIVVFFAQYGFVSVFFLIGLFFLFLFGIKQFLSFGKVYYSPDFKNNSGAMKVFDYCSILFLAVIGSAMLAGVNELCDTHFHQFNFPVYSLVLVLVSTTVIFFGLKALLNLSIYLVPFIAIGIVYICVKCLTISPLSAPAFSTDLPTIGLLSLSCVSYCCCNLVTSNRILFDVGFKLNKRQTKIVSILVGSVLTIIIGLIIASILVIDEAILYAELPLVYMAYLIGNPAGICFSFVMILSIVTTLLTTQYSFVEIAFSRVKKIKKAVLTFGSGLLFFLISLIGFGDIVKYFYPIIGAFGFVMMFYLRDLSFKVGFNSSNNKVHQTRKKTQNNRAGHN